MADHGVADKSIVAHQKPYHGKYKEQADLIIQATVKLETTVHAEDKLQAYKTAPPRVRTKS